MIKIAIVGTGGMAEKHATEFQINQNSTVVAACDVSSERLNIFCDKFNIKERYDNVEELLDNADIDAVTNATPDAFHKDISIKFLKNAKTKYQA